MNSFENTTLNEFPFTNMCKLFNTNDGQIIKLYSDIDIMTENEINNNYKYYATINFMIKLKPEHYGTTFNFIFYNDDLNLSNETSSLVQKRMERDFYDVARFFLLKKPNNYTCKKLINILEKEKRKYVLFQTYVITKLNNDYNNIVLLTISGWFNGYILNGIKKNQNDSIYYSKLFFNKQLGCSFIGDNKGCISQEIFKNNKEDDKELI